MVQDKNRIPDLVKELKYLQNHKLEIGIFGDEGEHMIMIANVHEFGVRITVTPAMRAFLHHIGIHLRKDTTEINIPERSFMRAGFDENESKIFNMIETQVSKVLAMEITGKTAMGRIGEYVKGLIQRKITDISSPPNHPVTVERKGSSNPLIDRGHLRMSITWRIV